MKKKVPVLRMVGTLCLMALWMAGAGRTSSGPIYRHYSTAVWACDTVPAADTFDLYVSNQGSPANSGNTLATPQLSISSVSKLINEYAAVRSKASLGLQAGSIFREQLDIRSSNISVKSFGLQTGKKVAQITGMDVIKDWQATPGKANVYEYLVNHSLDLGNPNYHYLFVAEIDTALERMYPVSAVKYLRFVSGIDQCSSMPGSFFIAPLKQNPISIYMHPTEGVPGSNRFRYEVVKRPYTIDGYYVNNCTYENLFLQSSGNGVGMLAGGHNTLAKNITFQGGGTHHAVIHSGVVDHSLFLPGPKGFNDEIGLVFYDAEGLRRRNTVSNTVFLDIKNTVLTHTSQLTGSSNYNSLTIDSVYAFADTTYTETMLSTVNTDSVFISNCFGRGYKNFWVGLPNYISIKNSIIHEATEPAVYLGSGYESPCNAEVSNVLITTNSHDANQRPSLISTGFLFKQKGTSLKVSNTIFYGRSSWHTQYTPETVFDNDLNNKLQAFNNIYISDVDPTNYMRVANANNTAGKGTASNILSDYNVYITLGGTIYWTLYPYQNVGDNNVYTLQDWQAFTGQDKHSIFIDLRNNPARLKAIFTDPENGNWTLAQTPQADSIRTLQAGMLTPPLYYPLRPTYEDALDHTLPGGLSHFTAVRDTSRQVRFDWKMIREPNLAYFSIESSTNKINFSKKMGVNPVGKGGNNVYTTHYSDTASMRTYYRLRMVNTDSSYSLSALVFVDPSKKDSIINGIGSATIGIILYPNPAKTDLNIEHPARNQAAINVYDFAGRWLRRITVIPGVQKTVLPLTNLPAGTYILRWKSEREEKTVSFIKSRE